MIVFPKAAKAPIQVHLVSTNIKLLFQLVYIQTIRVFPKQIPNGARNMIEFRINIVIGGIGHGR